MDIQVGDKVTHKSVEEPDEEAREYIIKDEHQLADIISCVIKNEIEILKIERPKYELIEEKKELLTDAEKGFLKQALEFGNYKEETTNGIIKFLIKDGCYIKLYYSDYACNAIYFDKKLYFKNLEEDKKYTLKELELEEI